MVYKSQLSGPANQRNAVLEDIFRVSKRNNKHNMGSVLLHHGGKFLQLLEGSDSDINELMDLISKDNRYKNIEVVLDKKITCRSIVDWHMERIDLSNCVISPERINQFYDVYTTMFTLNVPQFVSALKAALVSEYPLLDTFKSEASDL